MTAAAELRRIGAFIQGGLLERGASRWRSARGRWLRVTLTVTLMAAGVAAWALALVQPWKAQAAGRGLVTVRGQPAPGQVRAAAREADDRLEPKGLPAPPPLVRNPFSASGWAEMSPAAGRSRPASHGGSACPGAGPVTAEQVAEVVRGLHLKATVCSTGGERWAVINGKAYREGDEVAGLDLVEIGENRATLRRADVTCILKLD